MKAKAIIVTRIVFGLAFVVFGLNGFLRFIPLPELTPQAMALMGAFMETGYFLPFVKVVEILCGISILSNRFVPLALVIVAPVVVHIFLFHAFLDMAGMPMGVVLLAILVFQLHAYRDSYSALFLAKARPN